MQRLLGVTPGMGKNLGVDDKWAYNVIKRIGNYGESYEKKPGREQPAEAAARPERLVSRRRPDLRLAGALAHGADDGAHRMHRDAGLCRRPLTTGNTAATRAVYDGWAPGPPKCVTLPTPTDFPQGASHGKAAARHILVSTEAKANELKTAIENGADFAQVAKENSSCPSSRDGGNLGTFGRGEMVKEFDAVVFSAPVGEVRARSRRSSATTWSK